MENSKKSSNGFQIVYSCSGCSTAAQMANYIAIKLDRMDILEMSCIAGVGGDVKPLVETAKRATKILALDGCALKCVEHCLSKHGIKPTEHIVLSDYKVKKQKHQDFDLAQADDILSQIMPKIEKLKSEGI